MHIRRSLPSTGWYAVLALALVAALGAATVVGAGLSLWRGTSAQRAVGVPAEPLLRPGSRVITVPTTPNHPAHPAPRTHATPAHVPAAPRVNVLAVRQQHHRVTHAAGSARQPSSPPAHVPPPVSQQTPPSTISPVDTTTTWTETSVVHLSWRCATALPFAAVGLPPGLRLVAVAHGWPVSMMASMRASLRSAAHLPGPAAGHSCDPDDADHVDKPKHANLKHEHLKHEHQKHEHLKHEHQKHEHQKHEADEGDDD